jgi:hypothetical protein
MGSVMSDAGYVIKGVIDPEDPEVWKAAATAASGRERKYLHGLQDVMLQTGEAVIFSGTQGSLTKGLSDASRNGVRFQRQSGFGLALIVSMAGSKLHSVKTFAKTAKAVARAKYNGSVNVGSVSNMYRMSKTFAKTYTLVQVAAIGPSDINDSSLRDHLVEYWMDQSVDFTNVYNALIESGFINTYMVRKPSKLRSLFSRNHGGGSVNIDAEDIP